MSDQRQWFVGVDWGSQSHCVFLADGAGRKVGQRDFKHGGEGLAAMADWLMSASGAVEPGHILVAIEVPHGPVVEMLVDPAINMMTTGPDAKTMYAYESADPVEALSFDVKGIAMSDFVYPAYFEVFRKARSAQFDHLNKVKKPFQILSGGYQIIFKSGKWTQVFGSVSKEKSFAREDRRGHRSKTRGKKLKLTSKKEIARVERGH